MKRFILILILLISCLFSKEITDMRGNTLRVKDNITKAFSASPPMSALLYTLSPDAMIGLNYSFLEVEKKFMLPQIYNLPVLGGFMGEGKTANIEKILVLNPDVVFAWDITAGKNLSAFTSNLEKLGIPLISIRQNTLEDTIEAIALMGEILGKEQRAEELTKYGKESLARIKDSVALLKDEKKKVYFAQGADGLTTECEGDVQTEVITLAGGVSVHKCDHKERSTKREKITLEKLYTYNPDIIFVREKHFFATLDKNSPWRNLAAFKNGQIFLVPSSPYPWLSRPPSFMRFLGLPWMHSKMYPEHFKFNEVEEVKNFYEKFLHVSLSNEEIQQLFKGD